MRQKTDPIFALIAKACRAEESANKAYERENLKSTAANKRAVNRTARIESRAVRKVCNTRPTTLEGVVAVLDYAADENIIATNVFNDGRSANLLLTLTAAIRDISRRQT